jgi:hypothetical protein
MVCKGSSEGCHRAAGVAQQQSARATIPPRLPVDLTRHHIAKLCSLQKCLSHHGESIVCPCAGPDKEQERPLVVRRAKAPAAKITGSSSTGSVLQPMSASGGAAAGMPGGLAAALAGQRGRQFSTVTVLEAAGQGGLGTAGLNAQQFIAAGPAGLRGGVSGVGTSAGTLHLVSQGVEAVPGQAMAVQGQAGALGHLTAVSQPMAGGATLVSMQPAPAVQEGGLYVTYAPSSGVSPATTSGSCWLGWQVQGVSRRQVLAG